MQPFISDFLASHNITISESDKKLLLIEDDKAFISIYKWEMLPITKIVIAENALDGLKLANEFKEKIFAVILDIRLPDISGDRIYKDLKAILNDALIIGTSANTKLNTFIDLTKLGLTDYCNKYSPGEMSIKLAKNLLSQSIGILIDEGFYQLDLTERLPFIQKFNPNKNQFTKLDIFSVIPEISENYNYSF